MRPRVNPSYDPAKVVVCSWSLPAALAQQITERADADGVDAEQLVRELFLAHLPEFVADSLAETLALLGSARRPEGVDSS